MVKTLDIETITGLSERHAQELIEKEGYNEIPSTKKRSSIAIIIEVIREPMFLLLVACGAIYFFLGDIREASMLLAFVFVVIGITFYQERKTERALEALRDLSSPRALVIREGKQKRIAGRDVVRGDILVLSEGDRVPADAILLSCTNFSVDESLLTGESVSVNKIECDDANIKIDRPGGDNTSFIYSGTLVVNGQGIAKVNSTGINTEIGKIGKSLQTVETEKTLLQKETGKLVRTIAIAGVLLCVAVIILYCVTRGNVLEGFLAGITLAMAMLPEEFPMVLTIFLALGAWRISQKQVLTRRVAAVETLGSATVLCSDKTGTITVNKMKVSKFFAAGSYYDVGNSQKDYLPETFHRLVEYAVLASQKDPFDPMEKALKQLAEYTLSNTEHLHHNWTLIREYPLSRGILALSNVWKSPDGKDYIIAAKGAPEAIVDLCHLNESDKINLSEHINNMADEGLRVIGVARSSFTEEEALPGKQHDFAFAFLGLIGLIDPVRERVPEAVAECHNAGIKVVMITGDYPGTALNIARQIGLKPPDRVITGIELDEKDDKVLHEGINNTAIFSRVVPEQKLRLVNVLKENGEIVAMTGDGVNDAPALKAAHIGIAMGGRGTDVAREASSLVLLDDDFSSIVEAIKIGRRIFDNLKKAMAYIFAIHVPIAGMSLLPLVFGWPLVFLPVHIVFLELIIDPACSVVFESVPAEKDIMRRPPRDSKEPLFGRKLINISLLQGLSVLAIVLVVFFISLSRGHGERDARALTFCTLIIANLCLIMTNVSWSQTIFSALRSGSKALWWVISGALTFLGLVLYIPFLRDLFLFSRLHAIDLLICLGAGVLSIAWFELLKIFRKKMRIAL